MEHKYYPPTPLSFFPTDRFSVSLNATRGTGEVRNAGDYEKMSGRNGEPSPGAAALLATLRSEGIRSASVLRALYEVPRDHFVPAERRRAAWDNRPLPIGEGQTISQPFTVAFMMQLADVSAGQRVLEVGTGSGYAAALLAHAVASPRSVVTIETNAVLYRYASERLRSGDLDDVTVIHGDGRRGWADRAPYDVIIVSAQGTEVPAALKGQLAPGGRLVMPVDIGTHAVMTRVQRTPDGFHEERSGFFQFVPLV